jgi:hypothetical protein
MNQIIAPGNYETGSRTEADAMWFLQKGESIDPALAEANNRCMAGYNKQTEKLKILPPSPPDITGRSADESIDSKFGENPCPVPKEDP